MLEYGPGGLVGVLTPQANTTVEAEFWILVPPGVNLINARLVSGAAAMNDRLIAYAETLEVALAQFGDAPLSAVAFACTGSSYLLGADREAALVQTLQAARRTPIVTAAGAIRRALLVLGARRVALVSPYDADLTALALTYWRAAGLEITQVLAPAPGPAGFHSIYTLSADAVLEAIDHVDTAAQSVVLLGTGMPSLGPILKRAGGRPVISSNLCLAWMTTSLALRIPFDRDSLMAWVGGAGWSERFIARMAGSDGPPCTPSAIMAPGA